MNVYFIAICYGSLLYFIFKGEKGENLLGARLFPAPKQVFPLESLCQMLSAQLTAEPLEEAEGRTGHVTKS